MHAPPPKKNPGLTCVKGPVYNAIMLSYWETETQCWLWSWDDVILAAFIVSHNKLLILSDKPLGLVFGLNLTYRLATEVKASN